MHYRSPNIRIFRIAGSAAGTDFQRLEQKGDFHFKGFIELQTVMNRNLSYNSVTSFVLDNVLFWPLNL